MIDGGHPQSFERAFVAPSRREKREERESREALPLAEVDAIRFGAVVSQAIEGFASLGRDVPLTVEAFERRLGFPLPESWESRAEQGLARMREVEEKLDRTEEILHDRSKSDSAETFGLDVFLILANRMPFGRVTFERNRGFFLMYCEHSEDFDAVSRVSKAGGLFQESIALHVYQFDIPVVMMNGMRLRKTDWAGPGTRLAEPGSETYRQTLLHERTHFFNHTLYRDSRAFDAGKEAPADRISFWKSVREFPGRVSSTIVRVLETSTMDEYLAFSSENEPSNATAERIVRNYVGGFWKWALKLVSDADRDAFVETIGSIGKAGRPLGRDGGNAMFREAMRGMAFSETAAGLERLAAGMDAAERSCVPPELGEMVPWIYRRVPSRLEGARKEIRRAHETLVALHEHVRMTVRGKTCCQDANEKGHLVRVVEDSKRLRAALDGRARLLSDQSPPPTADETVRLANAEGIVIPSDGPDAYDREFDMILNALDRVESIDRDVLRSLVEAVVARRAWDMDIPSTWADLPHNHPSIAEAVDALSSDWNVTVNALVRGKNPNVTLSFRLQRKNTDDMPVYLSVTLPVGKTDVRKLVA